MCGIAGFLTHGEAPGRALLKRICDELAHRGPDGEGFLIDGIAALGHRRLSIIDLAGGDQPIGNEDGALQVVFNGEIYNYRELREELLRKGHRFRTNSDTEVLVHLYEDVGERLPEHLNGMFALAIWDSRKRELFLARDRFGKKPLYYSENTGGLRICFASELKALTVLDGFDREPDPRSVANFLSLSYVPDPATIYRHAAKLPPAHSLLVSASSSKLRRYWDPRFQPGTIPTNFEETIEELEALALDSVERRMISDVPLGGFLSGGVDSSTVVAMMCARAPERVKTFSIGFTDKKFDELEFARLTAERYQTQHFEETVAPEIHEVLDTLVWHFDEPFGDSSAIPTLYLSRMTRKHVTVALSGDGADELLGGYRRYFYGALEERLREKFPGWFRRSVFRLGGKYYPKFDYLPRAFRAKTLLGNLARETGDAYFTSMTAFRDESLDAVLSPALRRGLNGYSTRAAYTSLFEKYKHLPPLEQMQAVDLETWLPGDILVKADRATMAFSLEGRAPWLDYRIGEMALRMPEQWKIHGKVGKYIFKKMAGPYIPSGIITRPKMGFSVPLAAWFRGSLKPTFEERVMTPEMDAYLSLGEVKRLWGEHQSGLHDHSRKLWNLLMLACWETQHRQGKNAKGQLVTAG